VETISIILTADRKMARFIGEFPCKVDAKGRFLMPAGLLKQFPAEHKERVVLSADIFSKCLIMYPMDTWNNLMNRLEQLNDFSRENIEFIDHFMSGTMEVDLDSSNRVLIPKMLIDHSGIKGDIILTSAINKIKIWTPELKQEKRNAFDANKYAAFAEKLFGNQGSGNS
jgi:MraZ protein